MLNVEIVKYKGKEFPLNGLDLNEVLSLFKIPTNAKVEIVGKFAIVS